MSESNGRVVVARTAALGLLDTHRLKFAPLRRIDHRYYLVGVMDDRTRLVWMEAVRDISSLSIMFGAMRILNDLIYWYGVSFNAILTYDRPEMVCRDHSENHPVERLMLELGIHHRYAKSVRLRHMPKMKRFWRTIYDDLLGDEQFESVDDLNDCLHQYARLYNEVRPHEALGFDTPVKALESL